MGIVLRVDHLSAQVTRDDLIGKFGDYGIVEAATMDCASINASGRQSACVVMASSKEAQAAIDWLHDTNFKGSTISVAWSHDDRERPFWLHLDLPR